MVPSAIRSGPDGILILLFVVVGVVFIARIASLRVLADESGLPCPQLLPDAALRMGRGRGLQAWTRDEWTAIRVGVSRAAQKRGNRHPGRSRIQLESRLRISSETRANVERAASVAPTSQLVPMVGVARGHRPETRHQLAALFSLARVHPDMNGARSVGIVRNTPHGRKGREWMVGSRCGTFHLGTTHPEQARSAVYRWSQSWDASGRGADANVV